MDINVILTMIIVGISYPVSFIIGEYAETEIKKLPEYLFKVFGYWYVIAEIAILSAVSKLALQWIYTIGGIIVIANLFFGSLFTTEKSDLQRLIEYAIISIIVVVAAYLVL